MAILKAEHRQDPVDLTSLEDVGVTIDLITDDFESEHQCGFSMSFLMSLIWEQCVMMVQSSTWRVMKALCLLESQWTHVEAGVDFAWLEVDVM